uniref:MSP domain-containing protein n=1 Tax=Parastrongyloides trichosuri TaxID=131310 RepID=A0A0N4Z1T3_PARTI
MIITISPSILSIAASGGRATHKIRNNGVSRLAFKIKTSNNQNYKVRPVYGFIEPNGEVPMEIVRSEAPPKEDRLVLQFAEIPPEETNPQAPFQAAAIQGEVIMVLSAI